jgi:apolipoprotein N-acyltransferase
MKSVLPWLLGLGSGVALALALPGAGVAPLVLLFPGLMLEGLERLPGGWRPWLLGWLAGVAHWTLATNWVMPVMHHYGGLPLIAAVLSLLGMAGLLGVCWAAAAGLASLVPTAWRVWAFPSIFIAVDAWRQFWPYRFPWNPPAAVFADAPALLQSLPVWGATGLGWAALMVGAGLWATLRRPTRVVGWAAAGSAALLTLLLSFVAPGFSIEGAPLRVAVIQPGTSLEEKWDPASWREAEGDVWNLTAQAARQGAQLVLWPESAMPYRVDDDGGFRTVLAEAARTLDIDIVLNSVAGSDAEGFTNSAFVVTAAGVVPERYDKVRLVPFGEFVPWWARLGFADSLVREVGSFAPGRQPRVLEASAPLGMAICYEVIFAELVASEVRGGAELLTTLTNDGWYGYSWAPRQHFSHVVLRAVENRRWFARAALTGISGFVEPSGRLGPILGVGEQGLLVAEVRLATGLTPRVRFGDWWCAATAFAGAILLMWGRMQMRRG